MNLKNKNIVLIIKSPVLGGAERQAIGFARYAKNVLNCNVTFIATHSGEMSSEFKSFLNEIDIDKVYYFNRFILKLDNKFTVLNLKNTLKTLRYLAIMVYQIRKIKPYMIIPFLNPASKLSVLIYKFTGAKYTFWHQLGLDYFTHDLLERYAIKKTPLFIANAENGLDLITNDYNVDKFKLKCLPQYVSLKEIKLEKSKLKNEFGIESNSLVIGMVSHYRIEKLQSFLIDVFSKLNLVHNIHLVFLGDSTNSTDTENRYNSLNSKIKELKLESKISLLTGVSVEKVLNTLDIAVLVSTLEGTPNVVLEYMLYGLPVISTNHAGCQKLLTDKEMLIENDFDELYSKLEFLINNKKERERIGANNKIKIKGYSEENYFKSFVELFTNQN